VKTEARKTILFIVFTLLVFTVLAIDARADAGTSSPVTVYAGPAG